MPFFTRHFSKNCLEILSLRVQSRFLGPDEVFISKDRGFEPALFFIFHGEVQEFIYTNSTCHYTSDETRNLEIKKKGDTLGVFEFFTYSQTPVKLAKSIGVTEIHVLLLSDFKEVMRKFPREKEAYAYYSDQLKLNHRMSIVGVSCSLCNESTHIEPHCPYTFHKSRESSVLRRYNSFITMTRDSALRLSRRAKSNTLFEVPKLLRIKTDLLALSKVPSIPIRDRVSKEEVEQDRVPLAAEEVEMLQEIEQDELQRQAQNIAEQSRPKEDLLTVFPGCEPSIDGSSSTHERPSDKLLAIILGIQTEDELLEESSPSAIHPENKTRGEYNLFARLPFRRGSANAQLIKYQDEATDKPNELPPPRPLFRIHRSFSNSASKIHAFMGSSSKQKSETIGNRSRPSLNSSDEWKMRESTILDAKIRFANEDINSTVYAYEIYFPHNNIQIVLLKYYQYQKTSTISPLINRWRIKNLKDLLKLKQVQ